MITNVKVDLTDTERRAIAQAIYGSSRLLTRKEVAALVEGLFDHLKERTDEDQLDAPVPARQAVQRDVARDEATRAGGPRPAKPSNVSYMRGWNAVGAVTRRIKQR